MMNTFVLLSTFISLSLVFARPPSPDYPDDATIKQMRAMLISKLPLIDEEIATLSAAAKVPAMKFRELLISPEQDLEKLEAQTNGIIATLPDDVMKELDEHREKVIRKLGLTMPHP